MKYKLGGGEILDDCGLAGLDRNLIFMGVVREDGKVQGRVFTRIGSAEEQQVKTVKWHSKESENDRERTLQKDYCAPRGGTLCTGENHASCVVTYERLQAFVRNKWRQPVLLYRGDNCWEAWRWDTTLWVKELDGRDYKK